MKPLAILHLEDNRHDAELVEATLAGDGVQAVITRVDTRAAFEAALTASTFDAILADYHLPAFDGLSAQIIATRLRPDVPFIFLSGSIGEELAIERVKQGATDYVLKDRMARLPSAVRRALAEAAERCERRRADEEVRRLNAELEQRVIERTKALERAMAAFAESERRLQAILDHSPAIALKDLSGRYTLTNREFERVLGLSADAIAGRTDDDLFPTPLAAARRENHQRVIDTGRGLEVEELFLQRGAPHTYHSIKFPLLDADGRPHAVCAISIDITERKKADDAVRIARLEAERANRAKSEFLSRMSHDLRTPLNAILGFAQVLELDLRSDENKESVAQILKGGQHLLELINEVLDIAKIEAGHLSLSPEPVSAPDVVQQVVELAKPLATARGITLQIDAPPHDIVIRADRPRLNQILLNLLSNAVKYNRPGGRVTVAFREIDGGHARISVTDTGAGIPAAKLELLFQPFERLGAEQTTIEGTGLGLALSRRLAEAMGGTLDVESEVDRGTTFWVQLATTDAPRPHPVTDRDTPNDTGPKATGGVVLYVEDNRSNVRLMERVLERRPGVKLLHAPTGADGIRLARSEQPDLIFLDLHLPDMGGEDVLERLWQDPDLRRIPVAILSADATPSQARRLHASGAVAYLTKPLDIAEVMKLLDHRLAGRPAHQSL